MRAQYGSVGGPPDEAMMFSADAIAADFYGLTPLYLEETEMVVDEGLDHRGLGRVVRAIFRK